MVARERAKLALSKYKKAGDSSKAKPGASSFVSSVDFAKKNLFRRRIQGGRRSTIGIRRLRL
jgi:hypothetical protein